MGKSKKSIKIFFNKKIFKEFKKDLYNWLYFLMLLSFLSPIYDGSLRTRARNDSGVWPSFVVVTANKVSSPFYSNIHLKMPGAQVRPHASGYISGLSEDFFTPFWRRRDKNMRSFFSSCTRFNTYAPLCHYDEKAWRLLWGLMLRMRYSYY